MLSFIITGTESSIMELSDFIQAHENDAIENVRRKKIIETAERQSNVRLLFYFGYKNVNIEENSFSLRSLGIILKLDFSCGQ
jgi:hypothetical protein